MTVIDPRPAVIDKRLSRVKRIIAVTGWKGGIGKSVMASTLALVLARRGFKTGLLDLDLAGASDHIILGAGDLFPEEEKGIVPPVVHGIGFMSVVFFSKGRAVPLRGPGVSDVILEMFAVTRWGELDFLIIDMPPGIGDAGLDIIRWIKKAQMLVVTTPSLLARETTARVMSLFEQIKAPVLGVVGNMGDGGEGAFSGVKKLLGMIRFDPGLETAVGDPDKILKTAFAAELDKIAQSRIRRPIRNGQDSIKMGG